MADHAATSPIAAFAGVLAGHFDCTHLLWCSGQPASPPESSAITKAGLIAVQVEPGAEAANGPAPSLLRKSIVLVDGAASGERWLESLDWLRGWMDHAPLALVAVPASDWSPDTLADRLRDAGLQVDFTGFAATRGGGPRDRVLAVIANNTRPRLEPAPDDFRVVAIMRAYNEADILEQSVRHAAAQGLEVYIIDNWSSDGTYEIAESLRGQGVIGLERYPPDGPLALYDHKRLLQRVEELSISLDADWIIEHDMDELREAPWPTMTMRDAVYHADRSGFNSINHLAINFYPSDTKFSPGDDLTAHFRHYALRGSQGYLTQVKGWKQMGHAVRLVETGGHRALFPNQRIYPYRFLIRHFPLRSAEQAAAKISRRRFAVPRRSRMFGWGRQYDKFDLEDSELFENLCRWAWAELSEFDSTTFYDTYLIERLSGVGYMVMRRKLVSRVPAPLRPPLRKLRHLLRRLI